MLIFDYLRAISLWLVCCIISEKSFSFPLEKKIEVPFHIAVRVTTETGRFYMNLVREFENIHTNIDIKIQPRNSYNQVLLTALKNAKHGLPSGILVVEISELITLKENNAIIPLSLLVEKCPGKKGRFLQQFSPGFLSNSFSDKGVLYGLPFNRSTPLVYYNLDLLKRAGIETSPLPRTWDELESLLARYSNHYSGKPSLGLGGTWYEWLFESFVHQNGGSLTTPDGSKVLFNSDAVVEALEFWRRLMNNGYIERVRNWRATMNYFYKLKKYPVIYYSSAGIKTIEQQADLRWTTTLMPKKKVFASGVGATNIYLSTHLEADQIEAGWRFICFLMQSDVQARIAIHTGYFPVLSDSFKHPKLKQRYSDQRFQSARRQLDYATPKIMTRNFKDIRKILQYAINQTLDENLPAQVSLDRAQEQAESVLGRNNKHP